MEVKKKSVKLNLKEWENLFVSEEDCAEYAVNILRNLINETADYAEKVQEYFDENPEVMAISRTRVKVLMETLGQVVGKYEIELRQKGLEEE